MNFSHLVVADLTLPFMLSAVCLRSAYGGFGESIGEALCLDGLQAPA
jgi:hypothetical protein